MFCNFSIMFYNTCMKSIFNNELLSEEDAYLLNSLSQAFVGDAVYSLYVREHLCSLSTAKSGPLHTETTKYVKATHQAEVLDKIIDSLSEREHSVVRRARNTKVNNIAKNASIEEYKKSTAFEALLGYLYLSGQVDRLNEIMLVSVGGFNE